MSLEHLDYESEYPSPEEPQGANTLLRVLLLLGFFLALGVLVDRLFPIQPTAHAAPASKPLPDNLR